MGVGQWLRNLGLAQYVGAFAENDIDFDVLAKLTDVDLKELGVGSLGHRKRLLTAIAQLQSQPERQLQPLATSATGERRQVTMLFADLFTALSRSLDPEEIRDLVHVLRPSSTVLLSTMEAQSTNISAMRSWPFSAHLGRTTTILSARRGRP